MAVTIDEQIATNLYFDKIFNSQAVRLLPGEYYVTDKETDILLVTVLGSCVAACIRDCYSGIGGMNHFMLPDSSEDSGNLLNTSARYGTYAMEILINQLIKLGARRGNLEAKVFGGGNVLDGLTIANIGHRNADFALRFLQTEKIRIVAQDLFDIFPRKVYFFPKNNKVMVKKLRNLNSTAIFQRDKNYRQRLDTSNFSGEMELFS